MVHTELEHKVDKHKVAGIVVLSLLVVIWWLCMWELFENALTYLSNGSKSLRRIICAVGAVSIFLTVYFNPELLERL
jgi:hypothetical protein